MGRPSICWTTMQSDFEAMLNYYKRNYPGAAGPDAPVQLITLRSNDQFNTTIYSDNDRYRGVTGTRRVLFTNQ